ncbi:N-acetylmuramoyl-L-alanine amidase [Terrisporobacter glycolicus]|uniref:MurNAc-LAA domain-containing protein n=1 Tax=Terrisporobacter glycolicus ATCC 14880 = DSM 1288 TaxID=1121315 RepID=A0ABZ2EVQ5_9FIRM|nr:N-acetylmuramoyl-L-alanine amidase [Terrisporobacter glycolicus]
MGKKYLIALDDGHGMETPGKRTPPLKNDLYIDGKLIRKKGEVIKENEFNRAVVKYLEKALKRCGFDVLLVAPGDSDVPLKTRVIRANSAGADAYVSKHYNAVGEKWQSKVKGPVTIIHYNSSSKSKELAKNVHEELWKLHKDYNCKNFGVGKDTDISGFSLYVLRNTKMPAILTESGFMDNMTEAVKMLDPTFQKLDAEGTCKGICKTFGVKYIDPNNEENEDKNEDEKNNEEYYTSVKYIKVKVKELNIRNSASWEKNAISGTVKKNEIFTVVKKIKAGNSYMYKLKSGYFISADSKYVESIVK